MPKRKVTKEKGSTNAAPLPSANRFTTAHARVGRSVRARPRASVSFDEWLVQQKIHEMQVNLESNLSVIA
jgi:hypothetical protein